MSHRVLGLDLGPNSIGWALVDDDLDNPAESRLVDLGVRVFPEGVDNFDTGKELSKNEGRRIARGMRRQIRRRARRRRLLRTSLIEAGLWPADEAAESELYQLDPYELRARALSERLEPFEIGRVLLHLNQRRGFLSNRKKDRGDKEVQGMLAEINENERERKEGGFDTIGAWLADKQANMDHAARHEGDHVRNRHLARQQYEDEFEAIWTAQAEHHPNLLTDQLKYGSVGKQPYPVKPIPRPDKQGRDEFSRRRAKLLLQAFGLHGLVFFQRPMYWPKSVVGLCELEPKQKRCPRADRHAQQFRMLQEVNNLKYTDPDTHEELALNGEQRALVLDYLGRYDRRTFDQIRKKLGFLESVKFNLERGQRPSIKGMVVDHLMAKASKSWHDRPEDEKDAIVRMLLDNERQDEMIVGRLVHEHGFSPDEADAALNVDFPAGYIHLSLKAIDKLLPHMERGLVYQAKSDPEQSALHAAGYLRRDELRRRLFDKLPDPARVRPGELRIGDIPNPVVKRTLVELRKVVNAIIREYGKPDAVHLEMARSVQMGPEARHEFNSRMREREARREEAADVIRNLGLKVNRDSILRYLLWQEQSNECVYCGKTISQQQLYGGEVDVDHILPYSRCLDDSQSNKVVCHRKCNHDKGNRTPHEWLADADPKAYERVCSHVGSLLRKGLMPYSKYRKFMQKELELDKFVARQLVDTGYIAEATGEYLRCLFDNDHDVLGLKGQLTAELRWQWGLGTILEELPDSPAWQEKANLRPGEKNRADHRHHAIDAVVIALTDRRRLHQLSDIVRRGGARAHGEVLDDPWPSYRDDVVQAVKGINVSHRVERKVRGQLHEETLYGPTSTPGKWVLRKPVINLSASEVERIRDEAIRHLVVQTLRSNGIEIGRGKKASPKKMREVLSQLKMPSGVPVKKVRITKPELTIQPIRKGTSNEAYVKPGSTHHLCIFEWEENGKSKCEAVFVTMLEAMDRVKRGEPIVQRTHPDRPHARFVMSLASREMVLANWKDGQHLLTFKTAASTQGQIYFALHTDARRSSDQAKFVATANSLDARKVTVDPLGRIRWAND